MVAQAARDVVHESVQVYAAGMCAHLDRASMDNSPSSSAIQSSTSMPAAACQNEPATTPKHCRVSVPSQRVHRWGEPVARSPKQRESAERFSSGYTLVLSLSALLCTHHEPIDTHRH